MKRHCLVLDLKDDESKIDEYEKYHRDVWPEVKKSLTDCGIIDMEIYRSGNRLFMIIEVTDDFTFERKAAMDTANDKVQEWETVMSELQQPLPWAKPGEKWMVMKRVFKSTE